MHSLSPAEVGHSVLAEEMLSSCWMSWWSRKKHRPSYAKLKAHGISHSLVVQEWTKL